MATKRSCAGKRNEVSSGAAALALGAAAARRASGSFACSDSHPKTSDAATKTRSDALIDDHSPISIQAHHVHFDDRAGAGNFPEPAARSAANFLVQVDSLPVTHAFER